jgi:hypothetical protein
LLKKIKGSGIRFLAKASLQYMGKTLINRDCDER